MDATEIIVRAMQAVYSPDLIPFLAEGIREPRKVANAHADREDLALTNAPGIGQFSRAWVVSSFKAAFN